MFARIFLGGCAPKPLGPVLIDHYRARAGSRRPWGECPSVSSFSVSLSSVRIQLMAGSTCIRDFFVGNLRAFFTYFAAAWFLYNRSKAFIVQCINPGANER